MSGRSHPPQPEKHSSGLVDFVHQVSFDDDGNFFVAYNFADDDIIQRLRFAKWTGSSWDVGSIEEAPFSSIEIRMNSLIKIPGSDAFRISIVEPGINTVRIQETTDGGKNLTLISSQTNEANGQTINSADFVVP